jgi:hypothetical protein
MSAKDSLELAAGIVGLAGVLVSIWGTFLLTRFYHPFGPGSFLRTVAKATLHFMTGRQDKALARARLITKLGAITPEQKAKSLLGVYWIFVGFVLQGVAVALSLGDTIWGIVTRP